MNTFGVTERRFRDTTELWGVQCGSSWRVCTPVAPSKTFRIYFFFWQKFSNFAANFCTFSTNFHRFLRSLIILASSFCKIVEILQNSGKNPLKFHEILHALLSSVWKSVKNSTNCEKIVRRLEEITEIWNGAKEKIWKNIELEKCCKMRPWSQKSALIQTRTSVGKGPKSVCSKESIRWW